MTENHEAKTTASEPHESSISPEVLMQRLITLSLEGQPETIVGDAQEVVSRLHEVEYERD